MKIETWYSNNFESELAGRYITLHDIIPLLNKYKKVFDISVVGTSELEKEIFLLKIGTGKKVILAWSQMHGNETTTTKSVFDLLKFFSQKKIFQSEIHDFLKNNTLYIIPILNPDGAKLYTRTNANLIDLNRDAKKLSQKESKILTKVFNKISPDLCLNLHGQRTIFGLNNKLPAIVSFLSPAANKKREVTSSRKIAMSLIVKMNNSLQTCIPNQVGRYDDSFNDNCFGDTFQAEEVPVILFEAGQDGLDFSREKTREYIFYSLLTLFGITKCSDKKSDFNTYFLIPENIKNYRDFVLRNVRLNEKDELVSIAIQFSETLREGSIEFLPKISEIGSLKKIYGRIESEGNGGVVLINSQNNCSINDIVLTIVSKSNDLLIYFNKNTFLS